MWVVKLSNFEFKHPNPYYSELCHRPLFVGGPFFNHFLNKLPARRGRQIILFTELNKMFRIYTKYFLWYFTLDFPLNFLFLEDFLTTLANTYYYLKIFFVNRRYFYLLALLFSYARSCSSYHYLRKGCEMGIVLYYKTVSPPSRAVRLLLMTLNLNYELHTVDTKNKEHLTESFLKLNPQHTFPILLDDDFIVIDSHAINAYLVEKYGKNDILYPKDLKKRSNVDHKMYFDCGVVFAAARRIVVNDLKSQIMREGKCEISEADKANAIEVYGFVEAFLRKGTKFIADDVVTIADFSIATSLTTLDVLVPAIKNGNYPQTIAYLERCNENIKGFKELNDEGLRELKIWLRETFGLQL